MGLPLTLNSDVFYYAPRSPTQGSSRSGALRAVLPGSDASGEVVAEGGEFVGAAGRGRFLKCNISPATAPLGRRTIPFDPATGAAEPGRHGDHAH